jgi:hypothetical protein
MTLRICSLLLALGVGTMVIANPQTAGGTLDLQQRAVNVILDAADRICTTPPLEEVNSRVVLNGSAKAEVNGLLKKLTDLGISGAATYETTKARGVVHTQLADAIAKGNDCKLSVLKQLRAMIPGINGNSTRSPPPVTQNSIRIPSPTPQKKVTPETGSMSPPIETAPATILPDNVVWDTNFQMSVSGAGKNGQIYGWYIQGESPSFTKLRDAYIVSKLTGHKERLAAYDLVYQKIGDLDEIETVPPDALIRLGVTWTTAISPQQFMEQWGQMELVVVYNNDQTFKWDYSENDVRDRVGAIVIGSFGPAITRRKATP